ncbi:hypothetical protein GQX73_g6419 [Xylaria multiplex]|uniref:Uncharacterized protein n=1 Tax=Xylaria multiplex TaxID=323545 RepID=A0A7C8IRE6_9PEZI|nr:hypothetical protein GQX73_g6419 [Xylaria multiplex]
MPADYPSSDDEGGGAPLHPSLKTPVGAPQLRYDGAKPESPTDEEKALVRASENFGSLKDPFAETPGVPQSIPPAYSHRSAFLQPTPSRANNGFSRFGGSQPAARYRSSSTAITSNSAPRFRTGMNANAFNTGNAFLDEPDLHSCQQVFSAIMTATQYVNVSPGMSSQTQTQLTHLLQEISQGFSTVTVQLRQQRDDANRGKEDEHERFKRAMHELEECRKALDTVQAVNKSLVPQINHLTEREQLLKDHIQDLKQQLRVTQKQLENLTADAVRFHAHHDRIIENYKEQDEKHFKAMTELENEIKELRSNTTAPNAGSFSSSLQPASMSNVTDGSYDPSSSKPHSKLTVREAAALLDGLHKTVDQTRNHDQKLKRDNFVPNPQAPAWAPTGRTQAGASTKPSPETSTDQQEDSSSGKSGNSGEVILYSGHGNQNRVVAPYVGPPANGGAPTYIRTPFGVVFGEYPTVEENSRLPGDKMIPRDKDEWNVVDVQRAIAHLYDLCKGYVANCHMQTPPNVAFSKLKDQESYTWHYLMQQVYKDPEHAANHLAYLLSTKAYVPYLIQRTCVDYLLKKLLTPQVFLGFSDQMDGHLRALQGQLANIAGMPYSHDLIILDFTNMMLFTDNRERPPPAHSRNRQRVIEDHAKLIKAIAMSKEVSEFRRRTVERHANIISALLEPCRSQSSSAEIAQKSLRIMVAACWDISIKVWSSGKTLHYVFPECANKFSPGTMEALNGHHMTTNPEELVTSQCRVSLVVTPTMTLRDDRDAARMQCFAIHKAQVLVMK